MSAMKMQHQILSISQGSKKSDKTGQPSSELLVGYRGSLIQGCPVLSSFSVGVQVSGSSQQRLVHRQKFELPTQEDTVEELSVDGGNIRVRTFSGSICAWLGYKAISLHHLGMVGTSFQDNQVVIDWVNDQPLASTVTCIGDGHDGIWNIIDQLAPDLQRREVLDWFHLIENLHKVGGSLKRLKQAEALLWKGQVEATKV